MLLAEILINSKYFVAFWGFVALIVGGHRIRTKNLDYKFVAIGKDGSSGNRPPFSLETGCILRR